MKKLANQLVILAKQLEILLILRISLETTKAYWKPTREVKKQSAIFFEFAQRFETLITSRMNVNGIKEIITAPALILAGNFFFATGKTRMAQEFYEKAIFLFNLEAAWNNLGVLLHEVKDPMRALNCFDKAINLNVKMIAAWFNRGCVLFDLGQENDALDCFEKALDLDPKNAQLWFLAGIALFKLNKVQKAIKSFQHAIEYRPDFEEALEYLARSFQKIGALGKNLETFKRILTINSKQPEILGQMGAIYFNLGLRSQGISCYMKAADLYEKNGWFEKAQSCRKKANKA